MSDHQPNKITPDPRVAIDERVAAIANAMTALVDDGWHEPWGGDLTHDQLHDIIVTVLRSAARTAEHARVIDLEDVLRGALNGQPS